MEVFVEGNRLFFEVQRNSGISCVSVRLSLDPIHRNPFGHLMKFTQRSFPRHLLGFSTAFSRLELKKLPLLIGVKHCLETG